MNIRRATPTDAATWDNYVAQHAEDGRLEQEPGQRERLRGRDLALRFRNLVLGWVSDELHDALGREDEIFVL